MNSPVQAGDPRALLRHRLEALVTELAELEELREWVSREENRQRELRKAGRSRSPARTASGRRSFAEATLVPVLLGLNKSGCCNERRKANE
ncbi:hypothetical protein GGE24_002381 [Bradyrhizobium centrosematis]|jgi:hypothetical protein|nr:hypothetical protein [Bradyrhizobium centrosematis]MCS3773069.1 hypothetical protein [Bradyrhizobium centrosematis]